MLRANKLFLITKVFLILLIFSNFSVAGDVSSSKAQKENSSKKENKIVYSVEDGIEGRWVEVTGTAGLNAGVEVAKKGALLSAYRRAVNEGGSVEISEFSQVRNFKDVVDIITKKSKGVIKSYSVISEGKSSEDNNIYEIKIKAFVVDKTDDQENSIEELQQFVAMIGAPKVLFIFSEPGIKDNGINSQKIKQSIEEEVMAKRFRAVGYEVITSYDLWGREDVDQSVLKMAKNGVLSSASRLAQSLGVDLLVIGESDYQISQATGGSDVEGQVGNSIVTARAVMPGVGRVLHITNKSKRFMSLQGSSDKAAKHKSLTKAAYSAAEEMCWEIPKILSRETRDIEIVVKGIDYTRADEVLESIKQFEGVDDVTMISWDESKGAIFKVKNIFTGPREQDLARAISKSNNKLKVKKVSPGIVIFK